MPELPQVTLTVIEGPCKGLAAAFDYFPIIVGRAEDADFRLTEDLRVSRRHAQIERDLTGEVSVRDCDSRFGTYLGDRQIGEERIRPEVTVRIGECTIRVDWSATSANRIPTASVASEGRLPWRVWVYGVLIIFVLGITMVVLRLSSDVLPDPAANGDPLQLAREARNNGDFNNAIECLQAVMRIGESDLRYAESLELLADCKRLKRRFDVAILYEKNLRLHGALDEWRIMLLDRDFLRQDDPLRGWVQTQQIIRIEARLSHLR